MEYETLKSEAVVIKERDFREADKFFSLYTKNFGKLEVLGRGIRKIKAKLRVGLQILNYNSLEFIKGRDFYIATDTILKDGFSEIKSEIKTFRFGLYVADILDKLIKGEEKEERIWNLFFETLCILKQKDINHRLFIRYFEWRLLSCLGFEPELYHCVFCQKRVQDGKIYFSAKEGGILCADCFQGLDKKDDIFLNPVRNGISNGVKDISRDSIKILRLFVLEQKNLLKKLRIDKMQEENLRRISKQYLEYILGKELFVV